jgi:DNA-directed RNA polymerase subunit RPC12/RpoP
MSEQNGNKDHAPKLPRWMFPAGVALAGISSAATLLLRGCMHNWSWPMRVRAEDVKHTGDENYSYQACTKCGIRRLYDEKLLRHFGPAGYELHELIARDRAAHIRWLQKQQAEQQRASKKEERTAPAAVPHTVR